MDANLWGDEIIRQTLIAIKTSHLFVFDEPVDLSKFIERHKYFAFRVGDINAVESDISEVSAHSAQGGRGLAQTIDNDIARFLVDEFMPESFNEIDANDMAGIIHTMLCSVNNKDIVFFFSSDIRVQGAYDNDYMSTSIVGDIKYKIGIQKGDN